MKDKRFRSLLFYAFLFKYNDNKKISIFIKQFNKFENLNIENKMDLRIKNLFLGKFEDIPEQNSTLIRLFLSSTTSGTYLTFLYL